MMKYVACNGSTRNIDVLWDVELTQKPPEIANVTGIVWNYCMHTRGIQGPPCFRQPEYPIHESITACII